LSGRTCIASAVCEQSTWRRSMRTGGSLTTGPVGGDPVGEVAGCGGDLASIVRNLGI
jgi:hypothetical protein